MNGLSSCHPQLIVDSLSLYFVHQSTNKGDHSHNSDCNQMISTIIQSRDSDKNAVNDERFDTLPRFIIGFCASYLDQLSYAKLSTANRATYLGCNTPSTLQEVTLRHSSISTYTYPDLSGFHFATKLTPCAGPGTLCARSSILASQIITMSRLHSLDLSNMAVESIRNLASDNATNGRITSAAFSFSLSKREYQRLQQFLETMALFKNIQGHGQFPKVFQDMYL